MEQCADHANICKDLGGINANITNLTAAVVALSTQINTLTTPIYSEINFIKGRMDKHEEEAGRYREKIVVTEKVLQDYMKHQDEKEQSAMWRIGITVTIISLVANALLKVLMK